MSSVGAVSAVDRPAPLDVRAAPAPATAPSALLPPPADVSGDAAAVMMQIFADQNDQDAKAAKADVERAQAEKALRRRQQAEALAAAEAAAAQKHGLFDAIGIGGVVGVATGNPLLVLADVTAHMTHATPKIRREREAEHPKAIARAAEIYVLAGARSAEAMRAASAAGGVVARETGVLGRTTSDRAAAVLLLAGGAAGAAAVAAKKDGAIADDLRAVEKATDPYMKYVEYGAMTLAAASAIVASAGTATAPVVIVGVALSAAGTVSSETKALDHVVGEKAARYIDAGAIISGAVVTGAGLAAIGGGGASSVARALGYGADAVDGAAKIDRGLETMEDATIAHDVDRGQIAAKRYQREADRIGRAVDDMLDRAGAIEKDGAHVREIAENVATMQTETRETALTTWRA